MAPQKNPNQASITISAVLLVLSIVSTVLGLTVFDGDLGFWSWAMGGIVMLIALILLLVFVWDGKKKVRAIEALLSGEGLLARWRYSQDEWDRFACQERDRSVKDARKTTLWAFLILLGFGLVGGLFGGVEMDGAYFLVLAVTGIGISALVWGSMYGSAMLTYRRNSASIGETYISSSGVYFHGQYYTWAVKGSRLTAVEFEPGDPATVNFRYEANMTDHIQSFNARVPVPRGYEDAAQAVVSSFYES